MIVDHDEGDEDLGGPRFLGVTPTGVPTFCAACCSYAAHGLGARCLEHGGSSHLGFIVSRADFWKRVTW